MALVLNSTFKGLFTKLNITFIPAPRNIFQGAVKQNLAFTEFAISNVTAYLQKLDPNGSPGSDGLIPRDEKTVANSWNY